MGSAAPSGHSPIPHSFFRYDAVPVKDRFAAWSDSISPLFLPRLAPHVPPDQVSTATEVFMLGDVLLGRSETAGVGGYDSPGNSALRDRSETFMVQLYLTGGFVGYNGTASLQVAAGDIVILDLSRAMSTEVTDSAILSFILPRETLLSLVDSRQVPTPGMIAGTSPAGRVLGHTFHSIWQALPDSTAGEGQTMGRLLLGAVAGLLQGAGREGPAESPGENAVDLATFEAMRAYIERHLGNPDLTPEHLCRQFNCSRARLYRLFAPVEGVSTFIGKLRLERVYGELLYSDERTSVMDMALRWGFGNMSHFYRLFRESFGATPGEVRAMGRVARLERKARRMPARGSRLWQPEYRDWMARL